MSKSDVQDKITFTYPITIPEKAWQNNICIVYLSDYTEVDAGRTRAGGGSGSGLSILKNAIHRRSGQGQARPHSSVGSEIPFALHK